MKKLLVAVAILAIVAGCSSVKYTSDQMSNVDYSKFKTFEVVHFVNEEDLANKKFNINQINKQRIEKALSNEMDQRGLAANEKPDLLVLWGVGIDIEKSYSTHTTYMGGGYMGYRGRYGGMGMATSHSNTTAYETMIGQLRVAFVDAITEEMLWIGKAEGVVRENTKDLDARVKEVVMRTLEQAPLMKK